MKRLINSAHQRRVTEMAQPRWLGHMRVRVSLHPREQERQSSRRAGDTLKAEANGNLLMQSEKHCKQTYFVPPTFSTTIAKSYVGLP